MKVADIEALLAEGKSFTIAAERDNAPPVILVAAPRAALLGDVERELATMKALPLELTEVEVSTKLRPEEIQHTLRTAWMPKLRGCYEALLERAPTASGRFVGEMKVNGEGTLDALKIVTSDAPLEEEAFMSCLNTSLAAIAFPPTGHVTTIKYPIVVDPD
jgi:hypothetical protein